MIGWVLAVGFPLDITTDVATEAGVAVDVQGFEVALVGGAS